MAEPLRAAVVTVSDSAFNGERRDGSGPAVADLLRKNDWTVADSRIVPDDEGVIAATLRELSGTSVHAVFTTGGTGLAARDVTPEATRKVISREIPGLSERIRQEGARTTPTAVLSRGLAGVCGSTLILNLPGSPGGAAESLSLVLPVLRHAVDLLAGKTAHS